MKETIDLAWPATVESIFVGLASLVDTIMVSTLGTTAIAAIGLTNQPKFIAIAFIASLNVGITAIISRRIGANRLDDANACLDVYKRQPLNPFLTDNVTLIILFFFPCITDSGNGQIPIFQIHFNIFLLAAWQLDIQQIKMCIRDST